jgi:hypothetical protein
MTTSAQPSSTGIASRRPSRNSTFGKAKRLGGGARLVEHLGRHVDPDDGTGFADLSRRDERVEAGAGACVDHSLTRFQRSELERVPDAGE